MIGENIVITVVEIRDGKVRLGFEALPEIPIHREEVYETLQGVTSSGIIASPLPSDLSNPHLEANQSPEAPST